MERRDVIVGQYAAYWLRARKGKYGFTDYEKGLCERLVGVLDRGARVLEVASGTGYPFSSTMHSMGFESYALDLSEMLVRDCAERIPGIHSLVGDSQGIPFCSARFNGTCCFNATSYFPRLNDVIDEMIRVTVRGGTVMFDIQNAANAEAKRAHDRQCSELTGRLRWLRYVKNVAKLILRRGTVRWSSTLIEAPHLPELVASHLRRCGITSILVVGWPSTNMAARANLIELGGYEAVINRDLIGKYPRIAFAFKVPVISWVSA